MGEVFRGMMRRSKPDALRNYDTVAGMEYQVSLTALLGQSRLDTYLQEAGGDYARAAQLYQWATQVSGALHAQISFVEIAVRNAIDPVLSKWNQAQSSQTYGPYWTAEQNTAQPLYGIIRKPLVNARKYAKEEADRRDVNHRRGNTLVTHDDVLAQLMFGSWVSLIHNKSESSRQKKLWNEAIYLAFPNADNTEASRINIWMQLETLRRLRNRVAHHDNLLAVDLPHRLNGMLSLLSKVNSSYPEFAASSSAIRRLNREDPRRGW